MKPLARVFMHGFLGFTLFTYGAEHVPMPIVGTGQNATYDTSKEIAYPSKNKPFYGQDAQFSANSPAYRDNTDGTVSDLVTGLTWSKAVNSDKMTLEEAEEAAKKLRLGGYADWRIPSIKELYSLIDFRGNTGFATSFSVIPDTAIPFINTDYFDFMYGCTHTGERFIDAQWLSSTKYVSTTMNGMETLFGVNFADGRIKGYGFRRKGSTRVMKTFYVRFVRGKPYGASTFKDNGNGTVTDLNTGLMWTKNDSGKGMDWEHALAYATQSQCAGYSDWRLPTAKELQYLVDYTRSPDTTHSPAIDPIFQTSSIVNEGNQNDYPYFWTSTTHLDGPVPAAQAVYIAFGRAIGQMHDEIMDVHGAGAQRSDPKTGTPRIGHGPQGDAQRIDNYVRLVRGGTRVPIGRKPASKKNAYPNMLRVLTPQPTRTEHPQKNAFAQPSQSRRVGFVKRLDRNGDGAVSRAEFDGPRDQFDILDANKDGFLSDNEAPAHPPPRN